MCVSCLFTFFSAIVNIVCLQLLTGSNHLVAIDEGSDHTMTVWDTQTNHGKKLAEVKCSNKETVVAAEFHPLDPELIGSYTFNTGGGRQSPLILRVLSA